MQPAWWWPEDFWKYTLNNPTGVSLFVVEILLILTFLVHAGWMICTIGKYPKKKEGEDPEATSTPQVSAQGTETTLGPVSDSEGCKTAQEQATEPEDSKVITQELAFILEDTNTAHESVSEANRFKITQSSACEPEDAPKATHESVFETGESRATTYFGPGGSNLGPASESEESSI